ncbi:MAG: demethoxyubiquinone hydroxylase family protein [Rickettsiales bacterium]|nr:demethoxyubiquinone hydroxylase family protein [Rickettsiales bacterium]
MLPGDLPLDEDLARIIRVNHAGEYGAKRIYDGQLAVLRHGAAHEAIAHMKAQEALHLSTFEQLMQQRRVRPTALMPLWHIGGFALGAVTALMGEKAAMACTVAVEEVIGAHYAAQEARLPDEEVALRDTVAQFRDDEQAHHDTGLAHGAEEAPLYRALYQGVRSVTQAAIWLSTRI